MIYVLSGKKEEMEKCKKALLDTDGSFGVNIKKLSFKKSGWFKYELEIELEGTKENIKRFNKRVNSNCMIQSGNILGLIDYI